MKTTFCKILRHFNLSKELIKVLQVTLLAFALNSCQSLDNNTTFTETNSSLGLYREIVNSFASGDYARSSDTAEKFVKLYPFSKNTAQARFLSAESQYKKGKYKRAFKNFQKFIEKYPQNSNFSHALSRQFEIAQVYHHKSLKDKLLFNSATRSEVVEMYRSIAKNAPFSNLAPKSLLEIADLQMDMDQKQSAIATLKSIVTKYPNSKNAASAQKRIADLHLTEITERGSNDQQAIRSARDAYQDYANIYDDSDSEVREKLGFINKSEDAKTWEVAKFYQKTGKPKAAAIYFKELIREDSLYKQKAQKELLKLKSL